MLEHRGYAENGLCKQGNGFSVVMLHYPTFPDFKDLNVFALMSVPLPEAFTVQT